MLLVFADCFNDNRNGEGLRLLFIRDGWLIAGAAISLVVVNERNWRNGEEMATYPMILRTKQYMCTFDAIRTDNRFLFEHHTAMQISTPHPKK